jgi:hypothetical protein
MPGSLVSPAGLKVFDDFDAAWLRALHWFGSWDQVSDDVDAA